jgi:hypothetical protein
MNAMNGSSALEGTTEAPEGSGAREGSAAPDDAEARSESEAPPSLAPASRQPIGAHVLLSLIVLGLGALAKTSDDLSDTGSSVAFPALCLLILTYALLEVLLVRSAQRELWLLNPAVQSALFLHFLPTASALLLPFLPDELMTGSFDPSADQWAIRYEWLNLIGAVALWTGYWSGAANVVARALARSTTLDRWLRPELALRLGVALVLVLISSGLRLLAIRLGLYGYSASPEKRELAEAYSQYLGMAGELGKVTLVAVSLAAFLGKLSKWPMLLLLVMETGFGILSGFKTAVILPTIIVGMCAYAVRGRLPVLLLPSIVIGLFSAYAIIQPFRAARYKEFEFDGTSLFSIVDTFAASRDSVYVSDADGPVAATTASFFARATDVTSAANGIEFAERWEVLPEGSPNFLQDIFLSPLYSVVPRALWEGKPVNDVGLWYTQVVMGEGTTSSTAMYPVTYLNFAGGVVAVVLGFLAVGVIQSAVFRGLTAHGGAAVFIVVCLVGTLGHVDSVYYSFFISLIRNVPLLFALQWLLFRGPALPGRSR